jgi:hypothetical protein
MPSTKQHRKQGDEFGLGKLRLFQGFHVDPGGHVWSALLADPADPLGTPGSGKVQDGGRPGM